MSSNEMYHCCSIIAMAYDAKPATVHADSVMKLTSADGIFRKLFQLLSWKNISPSACIKQPGIVVFLPALPNNHLLNYLQ